MAAEQKKICHTGGCHCGAVRFTVKAAAVLRCLNCNCSICGKKRNSTFIVPEDDFKLIKGHGSLITYTFNTHVAKHIFCKVCGVQSFYRPRSNPDGYGVMPHCIDDGTIEAIEYETFDGINWEDSMEKHGDEIRKLSMATKK